MRIRVRNVVLTLGALAGLAGLARADVKPHPLFADGAVLQREIAVPVWGTADDGEKVTVKIQDQAASTEAKDGKWLVRLKPLKAGGPFTLTIAGKNTIELKDVLVGEVWVCSGQSNMAMTMNRTYEADKAIAGSKDPMLRLFSVPGKVSDEPLRDFNAKGFPLQARQAWKAAEPGSVRNFSAVGYYFGRDLRKALGVPVGLINSSVGGTPAEAWTSRQALESNPEFKSVFAADAQMLKNYPMVLEHYETALTKYKEEAAEAKKKGEEPKQAPRRPLGPNATGRPAVLYNGMIAPLQPYAIRGAIWYQGEGNAGRAYQYQSLFSSMIKSWRDEWNQGEFPFLFVQLAPFMKIQEEPGESAWAELRESQLKTSQTVPRTAMAVITDVGEESDIHPKHKAEVGERLGQAARALVYGEKIVGSGPEFTKLEVKGDKAILHFKNVGAGLVAKDGPLKGFTIARKDRVFHNADAEIDGDTVVVHSEKVSEPVAVRFGWSNFPVVNLWNKDGLPATPFRSDDFPMSTVPKPRGATPRRAAR